MKEARAINKELGINGGYISGHHYNVPGNLKITRARTKELQLQFFVIGGVIPMSWVHTWKNAPTGCWTIQDGNGRTIYQANN